MRVSLFPASRRRRWLTVGVFAGGLFIFSGGFSFAPVLAQSLSDDRQSTEIYQPGQEAFIERENQKQILWNDRIVSQIDALLPEVVATVGRLGGRVRVLGISGINFDHNFEPRTTNIARTRMLNALLYYNSSLTFIICETCEAFSSSVENSVLRLRRGIFDKEERRELAKDIGVDGFISFAFTQEDDRAHILVEAVEAENGQLVLSETLVGDTNAPIRDYYGIRGGGRNYTLQATDNAGNSTQKKVDAISLSFIGLQGINQSFSYGIVGSVVSGQSQTSDEDPANASKFSLTVVDVGGEFHFRPQFAGSEFSVGMFLGLYQSYVSLGKEIVYPWLVYAAGVNFWLLNRLVVEVKYVTSDKHIYRAAVDNLALTVDSAPEISFGYYF